MMEVETPKPMATNPFPDPTDEARRVAQQIHEQWPFIPEKDALEFYHTLYGISSAEGSVRVSLWCLKRVIEEKQTQ